MKLLATLIILGCLAGVNAKATDLSVGIVNLGSGWEGGGTALNLYATSTTGITLIETYVLNQKDSTGNLASVLTLAMNPAHTFVYVVYTSTGVPNIVGFAMTITGLVPKWERELNTGDAGMQGGTITAGPNYVLEKLYPFDLWVTVLGQNGQELMTDAEEDFGDTWVVSGSVDSTRSYYYSCRSESPSTAATSVAVFKFEAGLDVMVGSATPVATFTDPTFIQSVCN